MKFKTVIGIGLFVFWNSALFGQYEYPSLSPKGQISQVIGNTTIDIEYERPSARDRKIFGELVPWNKVWRTGAAYCTKISFDRSVVIGKQRVEAGKYSVFTVPNPEEWIVILNSDTTLYGSSKYQSEKDVARFAVIPSPSDRFYETLTFDIDLIPNNARIYISWENTQISFDLVTSTDEEMMNYIDGFLLTKKEKKSDQYAEAADHLNFLNTRLNEALLLTDIALEKDKNSGFARRVKMDIYEKLHLYQEAIEVINQAMENEKYQNEIPHWLAHKERIVNKMKSE